MNEACDYRLLGGLRHFWFDVLRFVLDFIEQSKHEEYLMQAAVAKMPETRTDDIGRSVFAQVDELTLEVLDRRADEEVLPRSWLIARILQEWAADHEMASDDRTIDLEPPQNWQITVGELRATG